MDKKDQYKDEKGKKRKAKINCKAIRLFDMF